MKGFGPQPHIPQKEIAALAKLCDRILDHDPSAPELLATWIDRATRTLGGDKAFQEWFVERANQELGTIISEKFNSALLHMMPERLRKDIRDKAKSLIVEGFHEDGLVLACRREAPRCTCTQVSVGMKGA